MPLAILGPVASLGRPKFGDRYTDLTLADGADAGDFLVAYVQKLSYGMLGSDLMAFGVPNGGEPELVSAALAPRGKTSTPSWWGWA